MFLLAIPDAALNQMINKLASLRSLVMGAPLRTQLELLANGSCKEGVLGNHDPCIHELGEVSVGVFDMFLAFSSLYAFCATDACVV